MELLFGLSLFWLLFAFFAMAITRRKGRGGLIGFVLGLLFGPLGILIACIMSRDITRTPYFKDERLAETKVCPDCAELIKVAARKCRYCGREYDEAKALESGRPLAQQIDINHQRDRRNGWILAIIFVVVFIGILRACGQIETTEKRDDGLLDNIVNVEDVDPYFEGLVSRSDDFNRYKKTFAKAAETLIASGRCGPEDFVEMGGWSRSVSRGSVSRYFIYCGGANVRKRIYLDALTGKVS